MNQRVEFVFCDAAQVEQFRLSFDLFPSSIARRWVTAMLLMSDQPLEHYAIGAMFGDEARDRRAIERGLAELEEAWGLQNLATSLPIFATTTELKPLREVCQKTIDRYPGESDRPASIRTVMGRVMRDIASYESLYAPEHHFQVDFSHSVERRFFLNDDEFSLFTPNRHDGWLYLDYAKTGVSPFNAFLQNQVTKVTPQDSFLGNAQILYREDHEYGEADIAGAKEFVSRLLPEPEMQGRQALGLIPLGKPTHRYSRLEVLELLVNFVGSVRVELFEGDRLLDVTSLARELARDRRALRYYHPYPYGMRLSIFGIKLKIPGVIFGWYAFFPRYYHRLRPKVWNLGFRMAWPIRKTLYFLSYVWQNRAQVLRERIDWAKYLVWKVSWPIRKLFYMANYVFRKYLLGKSQKESQK